MGKQNNTEIHGEIAVGKSRSSLQARGLPDTELEFAQHGLQAEAAWARVRVGGSPFEPTFGSRAQ